MGIRIHTNNIPPLCSFALGVALVLFLGGIAWWHNAQQTQAQWERAYGTSLAEMAAKSAIDATLNHDLVSLQVVLQDVSQSAYVNLATIHDVENNLLVQAGDITSQLIISRQPVFSAPISFQQSVAGYVTLHLDHPDRTFTFVWAVLGGVGLFLLVALLALADRFRDVFEFTAPALAIVEDDATAVDQAADSDAFVAVATAEVMLQVRDFEKLRQTLSADLMEHIIQEFKMIADRAIEVYGGQWSKAPELTLEHGAIAVLLPSALSEDDAMRSALFFAYVLKSAFKIPKIKINLDIVAGTQNELQALTQRPVSAFAVHIVNEEVRQRLFSRILFSALGDDWYQWENFDVAYQKLLNEQVEQLLL